MTVPAPPVTRRVLLATRVMRARHGGRCHLCGGPIRVGDSIGKAGGRWSMLSCIVQAQRAARGIGGRDVDDVIRSL